jgi:hypothetical protein
MITPSALKNIGYKMYVIFAVFNAWFAITIWFCYPETKGKTLEEIDLIFANKYGGVVTLAREGQQNDNTSGRVLEGREGGEK